MRWFRLARPILLAVFTASVVASAIASTASAALPEWLVTATFTARLVGTFTFETLGGTKVACTGGSSGGTITDKTKTVSKVALTFTGCKSSGFACESTDKPGKEIIKTHELTGTLGYIAKSPLDVGVLLQPTKAGDFLAEFNCAGGIVKVLVLGKVICLITPTNTATKAYDVKCEEKAGDQGVKKFEGGEEETLKMSTNGGTEETMGWALTIEWTLSVTIELMA